MENNEEKKGCCENKEGGMTCCHSVSHCCHNWKRCKIMKVILCLIVFFIIFSLGVQFGELKSDFRGNRFPRNEMRGGWIYTQTQPQDTGAVSVQVSKTPTAPAPQAPAVKQ